ncbi:MAG TPA: CAP domain-containing protein [Gaiellaceae bacterium]|nr:CAP domain-containing protein [Gaiellaceae bacterium]
MLRTAAVTALALIFAASASAARTSTDQDVLAKVAATCAGATNANASAVDELHAMYCGVNVVRSSFRRRMVHGDAKLARSSLMKADEIRRCGFSHTPCGTSFSRTFQLAGYHNPKRVFAENLAWGQYQLGSPVQTLGAWLASPRHRANLLSRRWCAAGIAFQHGTMFGYSSVSLWVLELGNRR